MTRRGFALLAVLWTITAAGAVVVMAAGDAVTESVAVRNRVVLVRARWAAEACAAIAFSSLAAGDSAAAGRESLGRGTTCAWRARHPSSRLNVARAPAATLARFFAQNGVADSAARLLVDTLRALRGAGALVDESWLDDVPGFPPDLRPFVTVEGPGLVDPSRAPPQVVAALPGFTPEAVALSQHRRARGRPFQSLLELRGGLSAAGQAALSAEFADAARATTFGSQDLVLVSEGWVASVGERPRVELEIGVRRGPEGPGVAWRRLR